RPQTWPPTNSHLPRFKSSQKSRMRSVWLLEVTNTLPGSFPLKSNSMKPVMSFLPYLALVFRLKREYCPVERNSVTCPCTVLLNGMAQKFVPATLPVLVERNTFSKSTYPPGVKSAPPMRKESGDSLGFSVCGAASDTGWAAGFVARGVVNEAFTTCADVLSLFAATFFPAATCCSSFWICSLCWAICFCCAVSASCSALTSSAMEGADGSVLVVVWPSIKAAEKKTKQNFHRTFISSFSPLSR